MFKYISFLCLILSSSVYAKPGSVELQLLIDDADLTRVRNVTHTAELSRDNSIPYPHVSFMRIDDKEGIVQKNLGSFMTQINSFLEEAAKIKVLQYSVQGVKGYEAEKTGVMYWCLEDIDKKESSTPNKYLKYVAANLKEILEKSIKKKSSQGFQMKTPGQLLEEREKQVAKIEQSYVEYSKGFPHMSVAKGKDLGPALFSSSENTPVDLKIKGFKIIYNYSTDVKQRLPQVFIEKYFEDPGYNLSSSFSCLKSFVGMYSSISDLLKNTDGLDSSYINKEINEILSYKEKENKKVEIDSQKKRERDLELNNLKTQLAELQERTNKKQKTTE